MTKIQQIVNQILQNDPTTTATEIASELGYSVSHIAGLKKKFESGECFQKKNRETFEGLPIFYNRGLKYVMKPAEWEGSVKIPLHHYIYRKFYDVKIWNRGTHIIFRDGNVQNMDIDNLSMIRAGENKGKGSRTGLAEIKYRKPKKDKVEEAPVQAQPEVTPIKEVTSMLDSTEPILAGTLEIGGMKIEIKLTNELKTFLKDVIKTA